MLEDIKGIGEKYISILKKLGINTIDDLINYYPFRYNLYQPTELKEGDVVISGVIETSPVTTYIRKNLNKLNFRLMTSDYLVNIVIFNRPFMKNSLLRGKNITVIGEYDERSNTIVAEDIKLKEISGEELEPVYHLTNGISSKVLNNFILSALNTKPNVQDFIPDYLVEKYEYLDKFNSLKLIHNPSNLEIVKPAVERFKYEELFKFMFKINYLKMFTSKCVGLKRNIAKDSINDFINNLSFELTPDQNKAVEDIINDLTNENRMNRLVLGDVGSGKTIVAIIAMYFNYLSGYQSAMLVPTEILALQHYANIKNMLSSYGINVEILKGRIKKSDRNKILEKLKSGNIDILISTHAVLEEDVIFDNLGLVVTDEQHRFGVNQRSNFQNKGQLCDVLYMSATPIPRTYALTIYGDMDISIIKTKPSGRQEIETTQVTFKDIKKVLMSMLEEIKNGRQVYVVCPLIDDEFGESNLTAVKDLKSKIDTAFQNKIPSEILYGKMKNEEKSKIMDDFKSNKTKILISTTVIEVGVDVPNATLMVIFNAERFGLSTIHQLRGRIGRNSYKSKCIMISDKKSERLEVLTKSSDGFYISEMDYKLRGEGDLFGTRQSGDMVFKIADLRSDIKLLTQVNIDSQQFVKENYEDEFENYPEYLNIIKEIEHID